MSPVYEMPRESPLTLPETGWLSRRLHESPLYTNQELVCENSVAETCTKASAFLRPYFVRASAFFAIHFRLSIESITNELNEVIVSRPQRPMIYSAAYAHF